MIFTGTKPFLKLRSIVEVIFIEFSSLTISWDCYLK